MPFEYITGLVDRFSNQTFLETVGADASKNAVFFIKEYQKDGILVYLKFLILSKILKFF